MGPDSASVTVRAATLAGGPKNQDRHDWGDGWAFVLDGASSFATEQPEHDGGWYSERLRTALSDGLTRAPQHETVSIVARAIEFAASGHDDPQTCPTSTIALARWNAEQVELYVLGDSTAALIGIEEDAFLTDERMASVGARLRREYQTRLLEGYGFDSRHKEILHSLQVEQVKARNKPAGFWVAGAQVNAAERGLTATHPWESARALVLATDGIGPARRLIGRHNLMDLIEVDLESHLKELHQAESRDWRGELAPRSKKHDDKTVVVITNTHTTDIDRTLTEAEGGVAS